MADRDGVALRTATAGDDALLLALYAQTRAAELSAVPWPAGQRDAFVRSQWELRTAAYQAAHPGAGYSIITVDGHDVGSLFVSTLDDGTIRIVDIVLLETWCGRGIGTVVLEGILRDADRTGTAVSLHVDPQTAAVRFYERMGFVAANDDATYLLMVRAPRSAGPLS